MEIKASLTIFSPFRAVIMKVISLLHMKHFKMGKWLQLKKLGKPVEIFVFLCHTFGGGALAIGCHAPALSLVHTSLCILRALGMIWSRQTSRNWHSI